MESFFNFVQKTIDFFKKIAYTNIGLEPEDVFSRASQPVSTERGHGFLLLEMVIPLLQERAHLFLFFFEKTIDFFKKIAYTNIGLEPEANSRGRLNPRPA